MQAGRGARNTRSLRVNIMRDTADGGESLVDTVYVDLDDAFDQRSHPAGTGPLTRLVAHGADRDAGSDSSGWIFDSDGG